MQGGCGTEWGGGTRPAAGNQGGRASGPAMGKVTSGSANSWGTGDKQLRAPGSRAGGGQCAWGGPARVFLPWLCLSPLVPSWGTSKDTATGS